MFSFFPSSPKTQIWNVGTLIRLILGWLYPYFIVLYSCKYLLIGWFCSIQWRKIQTQITLKKHKAHPEMESLFLSWGAGFPITQISEACKIQLRKFHWSLIMFHTLLSILLIWIIPLLHLFPHHFLREDKEVSDDAFFIFTLPKEMTQ